MTAEPLGADTAAEPILGRIDRPEPLAYLRSRFLSVSGWAWGPRSPVSSVEVFVGGAVARRAGLARPRPDVAAHVGDEGAVLAGFDCIVDRRLLGRVAGGPRTIVSARVTLLDGTERWLAPVEVLQEPVTETGEDEAVDARQPAPIRGVRRQVAPAVRVLWLARSLDLGGSQLRLLELVQILDRARGWSNTVVSSCDGPLRSPLELAGAHVQVGGAIPLHDPLVYEQGVSELTQWAEGRFDLVVGSTMTSFSAADVAGRLGLPSLLRVGEAEPLRTVVGWLGGQLHPAVERRAMECFAVASAVLFNSMAAFRVFSAEGGRGACTVLRTGVDLPARSLTEQERVRHRQRLGVAGDRRLLVNAATLWPVKGQGVLAAALASLQQDCPELECVLVGTSEGPYAEAIGRFAAGRSLANLRVVPFCDDLAPWWGAADVVVCSSETESLPASVLEAMAHGLPVLSTRVGDLVDLVRPGVNGWLCEPCDVASMSAGLRAIASCSAHDLSVFGTAARATASAHDAARVLPRTVELLEYLVGGPYPRWMELASPLRAGASFPS
jgi:glycosyltransferase involved in cell wall biosynthesis